MYNPRLIFPEFQIIYHNVTSVIHIKPFIKKLISKSEKKLFCQFSKIYLLLFVLYSQDEAINTHL